MSHCYGYMYRRRGFVLYTCSCIRSRYTSLSHLQRIDGILPNTNRLGLHHDSCHTTNHPGKFKTKETGLPTKDETSETIVRNLYWLFSYTVLIFVNNPVAMGTTRRPNNLKSQWIKVLIKKVLKNTSDRSTNLSRTFLAFFFPIWNEGGETIV